MDVISVSLIQIYFCPSTGLFLVKWECGVEMERVFSFSPKYATEDGETTI